MKKLFDSKHIIAYIYLFIANVIFIIFLAFTFNNSNEKAVNFFIVGSKAQLNLTDFFDNLDINIKINDSYFDIDDPYFNLYLQTKGFIESDFLILPESFIIQFDFSDSFYPIDDYTKDLNPNLLLEFNNNVYGLKINDSSFNVFKEYIIFNDEVFYIFLNSQSQYIKTSNNQINIYDYLDYIISFLDE